jgi:glycogen(starch) synthase
MYPPHAFGGYERECFDTVGRWTKAGHRILVLTSDVHLPPELRRFAGADGEEDQAGVEVRRVLKLYWRDHEVVRPSLWRRILLERGNQRELEAACHSFLPDVASAWAMGAMSLGLLTRLGQLGVPVVSVIRDQWPEYAPHIDAWSDFVTGHPRLGRLASALTGLPCALPDLDRLGPASFITETVRRGARERSPWSFPGAEIVPGMVDLTELHPPPDAGRRPWSWRLLHIGRFDPRKGIHVAVEALAQLPAEATLEVLGSGDPRYLEELESLAARMHIADRVRFGSTPRSELGARYADADALLFTPLWEEGFGLVPLEAMACGTPVVASPTGGARDFMTDGENCLTFEGGNPESLALALRRLAADPALRRRLVEGGLATAARFDTDRLVAELEDLHESALSARISRRGDWG